MNKERKLYIESCEISSLESLKLGGYEQKILIEGKQSNLPIVLCLHGGPGSPVPFSIGCRGLFPDLTDRFIMVYWDQLGCGKNNYPIDNSFQIQNFVDMTIQLIQYLKNRFQTNPLYLFAMSWGSILALKAAVLKPDLIDGVITCGQVLTAPMLSASTFDAIEQSPSPQKMKEFARQLKDNKLPLSLKNMTLLSKIVRKYTEGYICHEAKPASLTSIMKGLMTSPDYTLKDFLAIFNNGYRKNESLLLEMAKTNLNDELKNVAIPYHIFQGSTDVVTSTKDIVDFLKKIDNPSINITILPKTGHFPSEDALHQIFEKFETLANKNCE